MTKRATKLAAAMSLALIMLIGANCFAAVKPYFLAAGLERRIQFLRVGCRAG